MVSRMSRSSWWWGGDEERVKIALGSWLFLQFSSAS